LQYACLDRTLLPCVAAEEFASRVANRTDGRVQIEITTIRNLGLRLDVLPRLEDGTLEIAEVYAPDLAEWDMFAPWNEERSILDVLDLWGLFADHETQARVAESIREDVERVIEERSSGVVLASQAYPSNYFFTTKPLRFVSDVQGLRIRSPNPLTNDLLNGMGAIADGVSFGAVYHALENDQIDAAVSCSPCGAGLLWYEKTDYLVGPIPALGQSWITMSERTWSELPLDVRSIILEEAKYHEEETKSASLSHWDQRGVKRNVSAGMEHIELTLELKELMRTATLKSALPNWVRQAGGPKSNAVKIFNQKIAPIVKVKITADGAAIEIE
jgi:TRAP-type C4-dicarboxylate transport system substrate-binding protein